MDQQECYWKTKELIDLISDALFVGELTESEVKYIHGRLCSLARSEDLVRFFEGTRRGVQLRAILAAQAKLEVKEKIAELKSQGKAKKND